MRRGRRLVIGRGLVICCLGSLTWWMGCGVVLRRWSMCDGRRRFGGHLGDKLLSKTSTFEQECFHFIETSILILHGTLS